MLTKKAPSELRVKVEAKRAAKARKRETRASSAAEALVALDLIELISVDRETVSGNREREEGVERTPISDPQQRRPGEEKSERDAATNDGG